MMSSPPPDDTHSPRVFVSYDTESRACCQFVHWLAYQLRSDGIDATAAIFEQPPSEGWPAWRERQVREAKFVLVICNDRTREYFEDPGGAGGLEIQQEVELLRDRWAVDPRQRSWAIPVLRPGLTKDHAPHRFRSNAFVFAEESDYIELYRTIRGRPQATPPSDGRARPLASQAPPAWSFDELGRGQHDQDKPRRPSRRPDRHGGTPRNEFESILRKPPLRWAEALAEYLGLDIEAPDIPARLAAEIDALDGEVDSTQRLVDACEMTLAWFENAQPKGARMVLDNVRALLSAWLPRCRVGQWRAQPWDFLPSGKRKSADACDDVVLHTNNLVFADIRVAREDGMPVDLEYKNDARIEGRRSMPVPSAHAASLQDDRAIAESMADGYASQFPGTGQHDGTRKGHRGFVRGRLARLRTRARKRAPRYVPCRPGDIPETVLIHLKRIYPPLRFVLLNGHIDEDEQEILQALFDIFSDDESH